MSGSHGPGGKLPERYPVWVGEEDYAWHPPINKKRTADKGQTLRVSPFRIAVNDAGPEIDVTTNVDVGAQSIAVGPPQTTYIGATIDLDIEYPLRVGVNIPADAEVEWGVVVAPNHQRIAVNSAVPTVLVEIGPTVNPFRIAVLSKPDTQVWGTELTVRPFSVGVALGAEVIYSVNIDLDNHPSRIAAKPVNPASTPIYTPSSTKYVRNSRSAEAMTAIGITEPFKFTTTSQTHKRGANINVLHLAAAKVDITTVQAGFTLVGGYGVEMASGEFKFVSDDGYLEITNFDAIAAVLIQDGDTTEVDIASGITTTHIVTSLQQPKV